jgi:dynein heavy chain, axonemal
MLARDAGWMSGLENMMRTTIRRQIRIAVDSFASMQRVQWMRQFPSQVVVLVSSMFWASSVAGILSTPSSTQHQLGVLHGELVNSIRELTALVDTRLTAAQRRTVEALTTVSVHERGIVDRLRDDDCRSQEDFIWQSQLRCADPLKCLDTAGHWRGACKSSHS